MTMANNDEQKPGGRRGFFRDGFDSLVRSVFEAKEVVDEVAEEVREVARGAMGDEPMESGGRTFYRDRRKRVVAKDHDALVAIREAISTEEIEAQCLKVVAGLSEVETAFSTYAEALKTYRGEMAEFEAVLSNRNAFVLAVLKHGQQETLSEAQQSALAYRGIAELTHDDTFKHLGLYLEGVAYFRERYATELGELASQQVPQDAIVRLECLAGTIGGKARALLGLADEDELLSLQQDLRAEGELPRYLNADLSKHLASQLMQAGGNANQAHRDAEVQMASALTLFLSSEPLPQGFEVSEAFVLATRNSYRLRHEP